MEVSLRGVVQSLSAKKTKSWKLWWLEKASSKQKTLPEKKRSKKYKGYNCSKEIVMSTQIKRQIKMSWMKRLVNV